MKGRLWASEPKELLEGMAWTPPQGLLALVLEGVAFSLPASRGDWLGFSVLGGMVAVGAVLSANPRAIQFRALLAFLAAVLVHHPVLSSLQLLVALAWIPLPERGRRTAAGLAIVAGLFAPFAERWLASPVRTQPGSLTLLSWNVAYLRQRAWERRVLPNFRAVPVDLVVLQEIGWNESRVDRPHWDEVRRRDEEEALRLAEALELPYRWSDYPLGYRKSPFQSGCVVFSRYPFQPLPETVPGGPEDPPPAFLVEAPQGPLVLSPMHLWSPPYANLDQRRSALHTLLQRLPTSFPRIVVGDTNMIPMDREDIPGPHGFHEAGLVSPFFGGTWPSGLPLARLDAVFLSRDLEAIRYRTLGTDTSDHLPVVVQVRWVEPSALPQASGESS